MTALLRRAAKSQDMIGWREFPLPSFSRFKTHTTSWLALPSMVQTTLELSGTWWIRPMPSVYVVISSCTTIKGYVHQWTIWEIKRKVELLADTRQTDLPQECWYLLELSQWPPHSSSLTHDDYWVLVVMKAAKVTILRKENRNAEWEYQARWRVPTCSRNVLDEVHSSLQPCLNTDDSDATQKQDPDNMTSSLKR
jgi:hypothetical protein